MISWCVFAVANTVAKPWVMSLSSSFSDSRPVVLSLEQPLIITYCRKQVIEVDPPQPCLQEVNLRKSCGLQAQKAFVANILGECVLRCFQAGFFGLGRCVSFWPLIPSNPFQSGNWNWVWTCFDAHNLTGHEAMTTKLSRQLTMSSLDSKISVWRCSKAPCNRWRHCYISERPASANSKSYHARLFGSETRWFGRGWRARVLCTGLGPRSMFSNGIANACMDGCLILRMYDAESKKPVNKCTKKIYITIYILNNLLNRSKFLIKYRMI